MTTRAPILPGQTVGILGGGQLGRMFAIAARRMGYRVHSFDPGLDCPTGQVADVEHTAAFDDVEAARTFASQVDVVTFEFENIPTETLAAVASVRPTFPSPFVLDTCRDRRREKRFLVEHGFPCAPHVFCDDQADVERGAATLGLPAILKTATFGYDGKGQIRLDGPGDLPGVFARLGAPSGVLEGLVRFRCELSVVVARGADGAVSAFEPSENLHARHILDVSIVPARISDAVRARALEIARAIADAIELVGVLCVELFLTDDDSLLVNELAPRPHNSGHWTFDAAITSQFEQQLRAVCHLPLGDPARLAPGVAMANLLGDLWSSGEPDWRAALAHPAVKLHLYGKRGPQPGRKMGHLTACGDDADHARSIVVDARARLAPSSR